MIRGRPAYDGAPRGQGNHEAWRAAAYGTADGRAGLVLRRTRLPLAPLDNWTAQHSPRKPDTDTSRRRRRRGDRSER